MRQLLHRSGLALISIIIFMMGCKSTTEPTTLGTNHSSVKQSIYGMVSCPDSAISLAGVTVSLSPPDSTSTLTNAVGGFSIDSVPPGTYTIYAWTTGTAVSHQTVKVDSGANSQVSIELISLQIPTTFSVTFHVKSYETRNPIGGATIFVSDNPSFIMNGVQLTSDVDGTVTFLNDKAGWCFFHALGNGYEDVVDSVKTVLGKTYNVNILLPKQAPRGYADSLIACYRFSNNFVDSSRHGHDGTPHGCTFVADRFGNPSSAMQFNGTTDYITVPDAPDLNFGKSESFTIMMWLNFAYPLSNEGKDNFLIYKGVEVSKVFTGYYTSVMLSTGGNNYLISGAGTSYGEAWRDGEPVGGDGRWHLFAFSFDRTGFLGVSFDGGAFSSTIATGGLQFLNGNINTTSLLLIGGNGVETNAFKGKMDDVRIYRGIPPAGYMDSLYHEYGW